MRGNVKGVALPNCTAKNKQKSKKLFITLQNMVVKSSPSLNSITTLGLCLPTISGVRAGTINSDSDISGFAALY